MTVARACLQRSTNTVYQYTPRLAARDDMIVVWYDFEKKQVVAETQPEEINPELLGSTPFVTAPIVMPGVETSTQSQRNVARTNKKSAAPVTPPVLAPVTAPAPVTIPAYTPQLTVPSFVMPEVSTPESNGADFSIDA